MNPINSTLDGVRSVVRKYMHRLAVLLNRISNGKLSPNTVTITGLTAHIPIAWLIAQQQFIIAAILLVIFGLFDTLDGELARLQKRASSAGMLLDASTDRMKEVLLYSGIAYSLAVSPQPATAAWAAFALGASICVSYVKAKGETAIASTGLSASEVNKLFQDGLLRFEVRMFLLVVGLLSNQLLWVVIVIGVLSAFTAIDRLIKISRRLDAKS
jgi:phosphatidylglycerophosphate synthase